MTESESKFLNRELSWLEFNQRVLDESQNDSVPLLERLKFLAITASNLDEFYRVRVGSLALRLAGGVTSPDPSGLTPREQLDAIGERTRRMVADQYAGFTRIDQELTQAGIRRVAPAELQDRQRSLARQVFEEEIYPVHTPQALDPADEFPLLSSGSLNLGIRVRAADEAGDRFAMIPLGRSTHRWFTIPADRGYAYLLLEDLVAMHVARYFPNEEVLECIPFRISRNADLNLREDLAADLLADMEEVLDNRRQGDCVRLEIAAEVSPELLEYLAGKLSVPPVHVFHIPGPLDLSAFMPLTELKGFDALRYEAWPAQPSLDVDPKASIFEVLSRRDVLLHHPYESFEPIVRFIEEASNDPDVLSIKQTLYRTSRNSPIVAALARAAQRGKNVTAVVELKARFDEARNIEWARNLEQSDVQVIYGVKGLKTHAKVCIVVRREPQGIQRYVHFGTGNYNEVTSRIYSDISFLTSNEALGSDASSFFNAICGLSQPLGFQKLDAAPLGMRDKLLELIQSETQRCQQRQQAQITAKFNSLVDPDIIQALYAASQAGVKIRLNVRGICCLRPGIEGLSDQISVVSIVDRFLEHARILHFHHGGDDRVYISSADWMPRNLDRRVELLIPIEDASCKTRLLQILETYFRDTEKAKRLLPDGRYQRVRGSRGKSTVRSQEALYQQACQRVKQAEQSQRTVFEPHRAPGSDWA
jgi:polyphosphate kinase